MKKHASKKTIFQQFLFLFMLMIIPVIIFGFAFILRQMNVLQNEMEEKAETDAQHDLSHMETQIALVRRTQLNLLNDRTLRDFAKNYNRVPVYDYYMTARDVIRWVNIVKESNDCIREVRISFSGPGVSISSVSGYDSFDRNLVDDFHRILDRSSNPLLLEGEQPYLLVSYPVIGPEERSEFFVKICLDKSKLIPGAGSENEKQRKYLFLYDCMDGNMISIAENSTEELKNLILPYEKDRDTVRKISFKGDKYLLISRYSPLLEQTLFEVQSVDWMFRVQNNLILGLILYVFFAAAMLLLFPRAIKRYVYKPVYQLVQAFKNVEQGRLDERIDSRAADEFNYLYDEFNNMLDRLQKLIDENYRSKLYAQKAELKQMQSQISPHLLYNTYFMLHRMILDEDIENASRLSRYLGEYMEYITHNTAEMVPLSAELKHAETYLRIQAMRFGGRLGVAVEPLPDSMKALHVPRLILQPVIENYVKYGFEAWEQAGILRFHAEEQEDGFLLRVEGGCAPIAQEKVEELRRKLDAKDDNVEISGLVNIHRRLKIRYGDAAGICLERSENGTLITKILLGKVQRI